MYISQPWWAHTHAHTDYQPRHTRKSHWRYGRAATKRIWYIKTILSYACCYADVVVVAFFVSLFYAFLGNDISCTRCWSWRCTMLRVLVLPVFRVKRVSQFIYIIVSSVCWAGVGVYMLHVCLFRISVHRFIFWV